MAGYHPSFDIPVNPWDASRWAGASSSGVDAGEAASIEEALKLLANMGAQVVDVRVPPTGGVSDAWFLLCAVEAVTAHRATYPSRAEAYGPYFREFLGRGAAATEPQVARAKNVRAEFSAQLTTVLNEVDALVCPAGAAPALKISREALYGSMSQFGEAIGAASRASTPPRKAETLFTVPMDLAGTPAICLPSGFSPDGLPYSIQFAGRRLSEAKLCRIAYAYEQATEWHTRHPNVEPSGSG